MLPWTPKYPMTDNGSDINIHHLKLTQSLEPWLRPLEYERMYLPLFKVADTPFQYIILFVVLGSYLSLCIVTDMTLLYLTLLIYLVQANTVQRARDVRPVFGPMLGQRSGRWVSIGPAVGWCPVFAGRVSTLCWFSVGPCLRRCPGTAPTLGRYWCLLGFTILCNNVDFWLFRSAYMFLFLFFLLHTFWSDL